MSASINEIIEIFDIHLLCYNCKSSPILGQTRWYRCISLHKICQDCKETKLKAKCLCNEDIIVEHCKLIQALLNTASMKFKCNNMTRGCDIVLNADGMPQHVSDCNFRLVECPKVSCKLKVAYNDLIQHMEETNHCFNHSITRELELLLKLLLLHS